MNRKFNFSRTLQIWGIVLLMGLGGSIVAVDLIVSQQNFNRRIEKAHQDYIHNQKQLIRQEVMRVAERIHHRQNIVEQVTKNKLRNRVDKAVAIAENIFHKNQAVKSPEDIKSMTIDALEAITFDNDSGYFFVVQMDGVGVLTPAKPEAVGKNQLDVQDNYDRFIIRDMIAIARQQGEGYYRYNWSKPGEHGNVFEKLSFVKYFPQHSWFIGSGLYLDEVKAELQQAILESISRIRFGKEGYIFANRLNGDALVSNGRVFSGRKKLWQEFNKNPEEIKDIFTKELKAAQKPDGDFIYYSHIKLSDPGQKSSKVSFILGIPEWQWLIGAGVYLDDIENEILRLQNTMRREIRLRILYSLTISTLVIISFLLLFNWLNRRLQKDFELFISFLRQASLSRDPIDRRQIHFQEFDQIAESANQMQAARQQASDELKDSEERYRVIFNEARDGIILNQIDSGQIVDCNPCFIEISGRPAETLKEMKIWELFPANQNSQVRKKFLEINRRGAGGPLEMIIARPNQQTLSIEFVAQKVSLRGEKFMLSMVRDISLRKEAEQTMQNLEKLRSVGTLAGGIAHDFNNILTGLFGNLSLALDLIEGNHPAREALVNAEKSMNRAERLTKQLLTFARGGAPITESARLGDLIEDVVRFDLSGSNIKPVFQIPSDIWAAEVDKGQIQQVFSNLTVNARQAMPQGGQLLIELRNQESGPGEKPGLAAGRYIQITFSDSGPGIEPKNLQRIFEPYFTTKADGSGLGLATVHSIIRRHGGTIEVKSASGQGTTFVFYLPAARKKAAPSAAAKSKVAIPMTKARVLVMDDDKMVREVACRMLEAAGLTVATADDGRQAVEMYRQAQAEGQNFDLAILDLTIPGGLGGQETAAAILKLDPQARLLVCSGYANDPVMSDFSTYGFAAMVQKPYKFDVLLETVQRVLGEK